MDLALFGLDEDDELLSAAYDEATQRPACCTERTGVIAEFQCHGDDTSNSLLFREDGFVGYSFLHLDECSFSHLEISKFKFKAYQLNTGSVLKFVFGDASMNLQYLVSSLNERGTSITKKTDGIAHTSYQRRRLLTTFLQVLLATANIEQWSTIRPFYMRLQRLVNNALDFETWRLLYNANSPMGNDSQIPVYHTLHGILEFRLLDLCLMHKFENEDETLRNENERLELSTADAPTLFNKQLQRVFDDLLICSLLKFKKLHLVDLLHTSSYPCVCFKEMWLALQLLLEKWSASVPRTPDFWFVLNAAMKRLSSYKDKYSFSASDFCELANWFLHTIIQLYGFRSNGEYDGTICLRAAHICADVDNYEFWENNALEFLNSNPSEDKLRSFICLIKPVLIQWWRPRVIVCMHLWEYMYKRLNSNFCAAGSTPIALAVTCSGGRGYLDKYKHLLNQTQLNTTLSSYTLFTITIGHMVKRLQTTPQGQNQMKKILGRIYSKFSVQKFLTFNEIGIHNLIELYLVLCLSGDFTELVPKIREDMLSLSLDKLTLKKQAALMKGHAALLILHAEQQMDFSGYATKILEQLTSIDQSTAVAKILADSITDIFSTADDFARGEHILISGWLTHFLKNCTSVEQQRLLETLHEIFTKLDNQRTNIFANNEAMKRIQDALDQHVLPFVRTHFLNEKSTTLAQLASDFCIQAVGAQNFQKLFTHFIEGAHPVNKEAQPTFLLNVLASSRSQMVDPTVIIQTWLKCVVLLGARHNITIALTNHVVKLAEFQMVCDLQVEELSATKEPLYAFVAAVGKRYAANTSNRNHTIASKFNAYVQRFEQWLNSDLNVENPELVFRFYRFLAIVVFNCAQIVYIKSNPQCFFHLAITRYILPTYIQKGKPPDAKLAQIVHKIWPVLVQGIGNLNFRTDAYINKTLSDLIQKWTPNFKISNNRKLVARPFVLCIASDNQDVALFIFERLTGMFLATQRRQADSNACLVVTIFQEVVAELINNHTAGHSNSEDQLLTFMKGTSLLTLEHIMMVDDVVPSRGLLLKLFKTIIESEVFKCTASLKAMLAEHLRVLAKKHLSYYTFFYFELLNKLAAISHTVVLDIMDFLRSEIRDVEAKRGSGEDKHIRGCFHKLQSIVNAKR